MKIKVKKIIAVFISAAVCGILLSGCGASSNAKTSAGAAEGKKTLVIGSAQSAGTLDPIQAYNGWYPIRYGICQTLTKMNDDYSITGWLAEDGYTSNDDNTVWTFTIKDKVTFSNGNKLDAEAVKKSLENVFENGERGEEYFTPASIKADGQKLVITTEKPEPILPNKLADPLFGIIDTSVDNSKIADNGPIGTGPFVCESFDLATKKCVVVKNENYWNGEVKTDRIEFIYSEDQSTISMGLQSGDFDAVYNVSMNDIGTFEKNSDFKIKTNPSGRTTIGFMNQNGQLGDKVLREAILQMQDKDSYCKNLLKNQYVPGKTLITSATDYGYDTLTDPNVYNPDNAKKLLDDAGFADTDGDGFRETPSGEPLNLRFVYYTGRPEQQIVVEAAQAALATVGIKVTLKVHDTQTVMDMLKTGDYDLLCMSINIMNCGDPENQINTYFKAGGTYNATGYNNEEFNALMDQVHVAADPELRKDLTRQAEQILLNDAAAIYFCYPVMNFVMKNQVDGIDSTPADFYWVDENTSVNN
ncbi:ABC transporter substrate-binding protein [Lacrimispora amygdalina]|uniref:ABC transporter substrate-binding protein n=1 Tax=Lacrimispora amygdalina TaxID=253257 RepID=UPI000BE400AA|nr:ABC transporter substrate-binding protein [Lacrimispora amygdalina]